MLRDAPIQRGRLCRADERGAGLSPLWDLGGDWGSFVTTRLGDAYPERRSGVPRKGQMASLVGRAAQASTSTRYSGRIMAET